MLEAEPKNVIAIVLDDGTCPFRDWLNDLKDRSLMQAVLSRITRVRDGNFGDYKSIGDGVFELRIPKGPGLRVYYGLEESQLVVLIGGGDKGSQQQDIQTAKKLWKRYKA